MIYIILFGALFGAVWVALACSDNGLASIPIGGAATIGLVCGTVISVATSCGFWGSALIMGGLTTIGFFLFNILDGLSN